MDTNLDTLTPAIPQSTLDSIGAIFAVSVVFSMILFALITVFYVIGAIRKWKMESAVFEIRKDLAEIKAAITQQPVASSPFELPDRRDQAASPDQRP